MSLLCSRCQLLAVMSSVFTMIPSLFEVKDENIDQPDDLDVCSIFCSDVGSCLLDVVDELHNADDDVDKDVRITGSDVGLRNHDVHIGCLI